MIKMEKFYITPKGGLKIRFQGAADFGNVYKFMKLWLEDRGFADEKSLETKYTERRFGERKNLEIHWKGVHKISNYVSYHIEVTFLCLGISETEVQIGDIKRKMDKGDFELRIKGWIQLGTKEWDQYNFLERTYFIVKDMSITREGVVDLKEVYRLIKEWGKQRKYQFVEKEYGDETKDSG